MHVRFPAGTRKKGAQVSDMTVGEGATCEWQAAAMDKETTIAFYFEVTNQHVTNLPPGLAGSFLLLTRSRNY